MGLPEHFPLEMEGAPPNGLSRRKGWQYGQRLLVDKVGRKAVQAIFNLGSELPPHLSSPQAAADLKRQRLTPHLWSLRRPQPLSRRISLLVPMPSCCPALDLGACVAF